jgi:hypothetical protein
MSRRLALPLILLLALAVGACTESAAEESPSRAPTSGAARGGDATGPARLTKALAAIRRRTGKAYRRPGAGPRSTTRSSPRLLTRSFPVSRSSLCRWLFCQSLAPHGPDFADAVTSDEALWREGAAKLAAST